MTREMAWNAAGMGLPLLAALLAIPIFVQNYGVERFGTFSLMLAAFAYVGLLDLGLGSALTYRLSAMLAQGADPLAIARLIRFTAVVVFAWGALVGLLLFLASGWLPALLSGTSPELLEEARQGLALMALAMPVVFVGTLFTGVLTAYKRFTPMNAVRVVAGILSTLGPAVLSFWQSDLALAALVIVLVRVGSTLVHLAQCRMHVRLGDHARRAEQPARPHLGPLLRYGGWLTVSYVVSPVMVYMDRFYLAAVVSIEQVAHYVAPHELVTKLTLAPAAILPVFFPLLVAAMVERSGEGRRLPVRLATGVAVVCGVPAGVLATFGPEIMRAWMGGSLSADAGLVLQVLSAGVYLNCVAQVFMTQVMAVGRTDLAARLHVLELPLYVALLLCLMPRFGILGVALAWSLRVVIDTAVLCHFAARTMAPKERVECWRTMAWAAGFALLLGAFAAMPSLSLRVAFVAVVGAWAGMHGRRLLSVVMGSADRSAER